MDITTKKVLIGNITLYDGETIETVKKMLSDMQRNTFAVEYDRETGKLYAVSDSDDTILQDASLDRTTGKLTLTFEY